MTKRLRSACTSTLLQVLLSFLCVAHTLRADGISENKARKTPFVTLKSRFSPPAPTLSGRSPVRRPFDADPVKFILRADKPTANIGEEITLTITAHYLNIPSSLLFTTAGSNGFRLKLLLPEGFIQTGGDYADYIGTEVSVTNPTVSYTLKGYFTKANNLTEFRLLRSHSRADASSLFVEKARLTIQLGSTDRIANTQQRGARDGNCNFSDGQFLFDWYGEQIYAHYYNGVLFASYQDPNQGFKAQSWVMATGKLPNAYACFADSDPHSGGTTNPPVTPPTNPPSGTCGYSEGQFLFDWYGEQIYAHYYNGVLFAAYQDPNQGFKAQSWLIATGKMSNTASCFATSDPHSGGTQNPPVTPPTNPPSGNCGYSEGQFLFNWYSEQIYAHYANGVLFAAYQNASQGFKGRSWLMATGKMSESTAACFAESAPSTNDFTSNPELVQYHPYSYDDDYDPVSFGGGGGGLANAPGITHLPSYLAPDTDGLNSVGFSGSTDLSNRSEYEVQMMAGRVLSRLGLSSVDQLARPPFLPILTFNGLDQLQQVSREYEFLKLKNPTWSANRCVAQAWVNYCFRSLHVVLDVVGFVPGAGDIGDAINGGIYLLEGDKTNAVLSFAATMPIAGWVATGGKYAKKGLQAVGSSKFVSAEGLIWASRTYKRDKESLHAINHVYLHFKDDLTKANHGVFTIATDELIGVVDAAWNKVKSGAPGVIRTVGDNGNISYSVPMWPIGVPGGFKAIKGKVLTRLNITIDPNLPDHVVTAYPE